MGFSTFECRYPVIINCLRIYGSHISTTACEPDPVRLVGACRPQERGDGDVRVCMDLHGVLSDEFLLTDAPVSVHPM
jgi:hypothetical protein